MASNQPDKLNQAKLIQLENNQLKLQQEFAALRFFEAQKKDESQKENKEELIKEVETLKQKIAQIENLVNRPNLFPADAYPHLIVEPPRPLLDLPISKIIDIYHETPQILEVYCQRVSLLTDQEDILEKNNIGNFWVIQLKNQGFYLFPRPESFSRFSSLASFVKLFQAINETPAESYQFTLQTPAKLDVLKIGEQWKLLKAGKIVFGQCPLEYAWQQEISTVRKEYEKFNKLLDARGSAGLDFTLITQYWQQSLVQKYGELITLAINTCMPIAYAIYKGPMLVPCQILLGANPLVVPGWDRGVPWDTSIYSQSHSKFNKDYLRTSADHPLLPNQIYLRESNGKTHHTWAIAKSYEEATAIVQRLNGHWISLD
ncbi:MULTISPECIES: hypothetical protein [unclassified Synechocystis]|uniref:hypothetical protein n=1 Tax=unclassified Synechocystis TaxID=2640012 RepID=UPI000406891D|nr:MULTISPECIES: hypothetical protein [unclassified Synechocystis]AIE73988.1 hypothetical protein D082_14600 [Synechocystis sp. PCC 6714]MCT0252549.1 hypothetical protein [Synechocystis sp. CS-94]